MSSLPTVVRQRLVRFEQAAFLPGRAVLHTVPVALCLIIGAVLGQPGFWFIASVGALLFGTVSYALAVVFITVFSVDPVEMLGSAGTEPTFSRALGTLLGAIVIAGAAIAPRRSGPRLASELAQMADDLHWVLEQVKVGETAWPGSSPGFMPSGSISRHRLRRLLNQRWVGLWRRLNQRSLQPGNAM